MSETKGKGLGVKEVIEGLWEAAQLLMMIIGFKGVREAKPGEERKEAARQHLPRLFGWGKADERIWAELMVPLGMRKNLTLTSLLSVMTDKEVTNFRIEITGMKAQMTVGDEKNRENIEFTDHDIRVRFLKEIVAMVEDKGPRAVVHILRTHQLIGGSSSSEKLKSFAAKFLGLADIGDLADPAKVTEAINKNMRLKIQKKLEEINKPTSKAEAFVGRLFNI